MGENVRFDVRGIAPADLYSFKTWVYDTALREFNLIDWLIDDPAAGG